MGQNRSLAEAGHLPAFFDVDDAVGAHHRRQHNRGGNVRIAVQLHDGRQRLIRQDIAVGGHDQIIGDAGLFEPVADGAASAQRALFHDGLDRESGDSWFREVGLDDVVAVPGEQYGASDALRPKPGQVVVQERDAVDGRHWLGPVVGERPKALATASSEHQRSRYRRRVVRGHGRESSRAGNRRKAPEKTPALRAGQTNIASPGLSLYPSRIP